MKDNDSKKINNTMLKVLYTLKFLVDNSAVSISEISSYLEAQVGDRQKYSSAIIRKYIATLKYCGIKIEKQSGLYRITKLPFVIDFSNDELDAIELLSTLGNNSSHTKNKKLLSNFVEKIKLRYSNSAVEWSKTNPKNRTYNSQISEEDKEKITLYEKYCDDELKLKITSSYIKCQEPLMCEPVKVEYSPYDIYFKVFLPKSGNIISIPINRIEKIEQLPIRSTNIIKPNVVTFQLLNKLAQNYELRDDERSLGVNDLGYITVLNNMEDQTMLLYRLMRYAENCVVKSPKNLRSQMIEEINETLKNYESQ